MTLTTQPRSYRRFIFALCVAASDSPLSPEEKGAIQVCLLDQDWAPTPQDTPVAFGVVEAWQAQQRAGRRMHHG